MKKILAAAMIMAAGYAFAETPALYECIYSYRIKPDQREEGGNTGGKDLSETTDCILQFGEDLSKFYDYAAYRLDSGSAIQHIDSETKNKFEEEYYKVEKFFGQLIMTDTDGARLTVFSDMSPDRFKYVQKLPLMEWQIEDANETICGYECKKASGEYGGRKWTVWYTEEIPVTFGPWKLSGLPGLILKATDSKGMHDFEATSIRKASGEIAFPKYPNLNSISFDKFIERKNKYDRNPMGNINPESISMITVKNGSSIIINGVRIRNYSKGYAPLEFSPSEIKKSRDEKGRVVSIDNLFDDITVVGVGAVKNRLPHS